MVVNPREGADMQALFMCIYCQHLDWQVSSVVQISDSLCRMFCGGIIHPSNMRYMISHLKTTRSTAPSGANLLGRLAT